MEDERVLKDLIEQLMDDYHLKGKMQEKNLNRDWSKIVGEMIAKNTKSIKKYKDTLYVEVSSPALKNELNYLKSSILEKINQYFGDETIRQIQIK
jgi:predicted nucleic acid-binding Zn ribbon protein